jgi:hypothetical protein
MSVEVEIEEMLHLLDKIVEQLELQTKLLEVLVLKGEK